MKVTLEGPVEFTRNENGFEYTEEEPVTRTVEAETPEEIALAYSASAAGILDELGGGERRFTEVQFDDCRAVRAGHPHNDDSEEVDWDVTVGPISPRRLYNAAATYAEGRDKELFKVIHEWGTSGRDGGRDTGARHLLLDLLLHYGGGRDAVYEASLPEEYSDLETGY